mmetsp:Transcript_32546/g.83160  ORF Transcript_32546/g.83160 Transcript_32546/m.83160 type:complete len:327 (-) Transcript_32546:318-1298(-)
MRRCGLARSRGSRCAARWCSSSPTWRSAHSSTCSSTAVHWTASGSWRTWRACRTSPTWQCCTCTRPSAGGGAGRVCAPSTLPRSGMRCTTSSSWRAWVAIKHGPLASLHSTLPLYTSSRSACCGFSPPRWPTTSASSLRRMQLTATTSFWMRTPPHCAASHHHPLRSPTTWARTSTSMMSSRLSVLPARAAFAWRTSTTCSRRSAAMRRSMSRQWRHASARGSSRRLRTQRPPSPSLQPPLMQWTWRCGIWRTWLLLRRCPRCSRVSPTLPASTLSLAQPKHSVTYLPRLRRCLGFDPAWRSPFEGSALMDVLRQHRHTRHERRGP